MQPPIIRPVYVNKTRSFRRLIVLPGTLLIACMVLCSCIFLPRTTTRYDPACGITQRHMTLDAYEIAAFGGCRNEGCAELLVLAGAVSAASLVVSGSVVAVGEVVYWLEAKGRCLTVPGF